MYKMNNLGRVGAKILQMSGEIGNAEFSGALSQLLPQWRFVYPSAKLADSSSNFDFSPVLSLHAYQPSVEHCVNSALPILCFWMRFKASQWLLRLLNEKSQCRRRGSEVVQPQRGCTSKSKRRKRGKLSCQGPKRVFCHRLIDIFIDI